MDGKGGGLHLLLRLGSPQGPGGREGQGALGPARAKGPAEQRCPLTAQGPRKDGRSRTATGPHQVPRSPQGRIGEAPADGREQGRGAWPGGGRVGGGVPVWSPRTSSSPGEASSAGPPARCSLRSRAASSPTGLGCVRPCARSYSTHRLVSASPAAGDPVRAQASAGEPMAGGVVQVRSSRQVPPSPPAASNTRAHPGTLVIGPRVPPAPGPASPPISQAHTPGGLRLRLGTCTSGLLAFLVERGPGDMATETAPRPSSRLGAASSGAGTGICTVTGRSGVPAVPSPGEGVSIGPAGR